MALRLTLDVVRAGVLSWNRSAVLVPEALIREVRLLSAGTVVEAECAWGAGGLAILKAPRVLSGGGSRDARIKVAFERSNWDSLLELADEQPRTTLTAAWRTRALLELGRPEFAAAFAELVSREGIDLSDAPTGLWKIRQEIDEDRWLALDRRVRATAFQLAWRGLLDAPRFKDQPFAQTLFFELRELLEAVDASARPAQIHAGGPRLLHEPDAFAWCAANLGPFATRAERSELADVFELLARNKPKERAQLRALRSNARNVTSVTYAVNAMVTALTSRQSNRAYQRALGLIGAVLARSAPVKAKAFLSELDRMALVHEARALVPRSQAGLRARITSVSYRGSVELRIGELDAVVGQTNESWFALWRHGRRWLCVEGDRDDALAAIPDVLFEEAVARVLSQRSTCMPSSTTRPGGRPK